jgi:hypothetical protein
VWACGVLAYKLNEVLHKDLFQITEVMKFLLNIPNTPVDSYDNDSHAVFHAPCIPRIVSYESLHYTSCWLFLAHELLGRTLVPRSNKTALSSVCTHCQV